MKKILAFKKYIFALALIFALTAAFALSPANTFASDTELTDEASPDEEDEDSGDEEEYEPFELDLSLANLPEYTGGKTELNVYNWGQYISDGTDGYLNVIDEFEKVYPDIHVNYLTFDSNESMYTKLQTNSSSFDLLIPSDYMIEKLIREDRLEPLDFSNIPNYGLIDEAFRNMAHDPDNIYSVPYTWGMVGIIYNGLYVNEEDVGSWDLLWNNNYAGKILMFDNCRDAFAIAEHLLGYSLNTEEPAELEAAAKKLVEQKSLVQAYVMDQIFDKMERGEAWIAPYYAGDYLLMLEENPDLEYCAPEEGYNIFVDSCCIPKGAEHKLAAELFINFLCEPQISGQNLEYLSYSSPISASRDFMDPEFAENEIVSPSEETLSKGESFYALSDAGNQLMNELWLNVKTSNNMLMDYLIPVAAIIVVVAGSWLAVTLVKRERKKKRCTH